MTYVVLVVVGVVVVGVVVLYIIRGAWQIIGKKAYVDVEVVVGSVDDVLVGSVDDTLVLVVVVVLPRDQKRKAS